MISRKERLFFKISLLLHKHLFQVGGILENKFFWIIYPFIIWVCSRSLPVSILIKSALRDSYEASAWWTCTGTSDENMSKNQPDTKFANMFQKLLINTIKVKANNWKV